MQKDRLRAAILPGKQKMLIVLPNWVGDLTWATPALNSIRRHFAEAHISLLIRPHLSDLVNGGGVADELIPWSKPKGKVRRRESFLTLSGKLRDRKFDLAALMTNSFRAALLAKLAGIQRIIGYDRDGRGLLLTDRLLAPRLGGRFLPIPMAHYFNGIARYLGCEDVQQVPILQTVPDDDAAIDMFFAQHEIPGDKPVVVINPSASFGSAKCWIPERFAEVADALIENRSATVIIVCGPGEVEISRMIRQSMKQTVIVCDDPILPLGQMAALFKRTSLLVTNDTGARPMAMAFGVPIVTIFGSTDPAWTEVHYPHERKVLIPVDCGPCMKRVCPLDHRCMTGVTSAMVLEAADDLLARRISERATV